MVSLATFALHRLFEFFLGGVLPSAPLPGTPFQMAILIAVAIVFLGLLWIEEILPLSEDRPFWKKLYVHIGAGLYSDSLLDRLLEPRFAGIDPSHPDGSLLLSANKKTPHSREVLP
jgi:NAD(P)H-quinone oxidoreductase subunit 5